MPKYNRTGHVLLITYKIINLEMKLTVADIDDQTRFRPMLEIPYSELAGFILDNIRKGSAVTYFFWSVCSVSFALAIYTRINIAGQYPYSTIILHSLLGIIVLPLVSVPIHELMHIIPFYLSGARNIRAGMDLHQFFFYVTAHRFVAGPGQFSMVAVIPFLVISVSVLIMMLNIPGPWKWSLSLFVFFHTTMCAGDFAMLNFYWINRDKKIYTWDDADRKIAYFYEMTAQ